MKCTVLAEYFERIKMELCQIILILFLFMLRVTKCDIGVNQIRTNCSNSSIVVQSIFNIIISGHNVTAH